MVDYGCCVENLSPFCCLVLFAFKDDFINNQVFCHMLLLNVKKMEFSRFTMQEVPFTLQFIYFL